MRAIVAVIAFAVAVVGCRGEEREQPASGGTGAAPDDASGRPRASKDDASVVTYAGEWNAVMQRFHAATTRLPEPEISAAMTTAQKRQAAATAMRAAGDRIAEVAGELERLHPPPQLARLHALTRRFFREQIDGFAALADAMAQGGDVSVLARSIQGGNEAAMAQVEEEAKRALGELGVRPAR